MTITTTCTEITVSSQTLDDFTALSSNTLRLDVKFNCGTVQELPIILADITGDSVSILPEDLGFAETFSDGVYSITLVNTDGNTITSEFGCTFMDCVTRCKIVNATTELKTKYGISSFKDFNKITDPLEKKAVFDTMYMVQLHTALSYIGSCTECTCDNGCLLWCELQKLLGEDGCYTC
jgi:hypothetical protein